jgi:integrase
VAVANKTKAVRLDGKTERAKLAASGTPYYAAAIGDDLHLGYRRGKKGGVWVARKRSGGKYLVETLASADDTHPADGVSVLNWHQAQSAARAWAKIAKPAFIEDAPEPVAPMTVAEAMADYLRYLEGNAKSPETARNRATVHILPTLGNRRVDQLTTTELRDWRDGLAAAPRLWKGKALAAPHGIDADEIERRRKSNANRTMNVLKAALNFVYRENGEGRVGKTDKAWSILEPFSGADAARIRYLTREECVRLANAADKPFRDLASAAILTGCRYGELARLRVEDFHAESGTLHVRVAKSGAGRQVILTDEGIAFFASLCAGRPDNALMLTKADGGPWRKSDQGYEIEKTRKRANMEKANFHCLRHTFASHAVMDGVPLLVIAQNLGHKDTKMVEKHYGHLSHDHKKQMIREKIRPFGLIGDDNVVVSLHKGRAS